MDRNENPIIAIIKVRIENNQQEIYIKQNDQIERVAKNFCEKFKINESFRTQIEELIHSEIEKNQKAQIQKKLVNESSTSTKESLMKTNQKTAPDFEFMKDRQITPPELFRQQSHSKHDSSEILSNKYEQWFQKIKEKQFEQDERKHHQRTYSAKQNSQLKNQIISKQNKPLPTEESNENSKVLSKYTFKHFIQNNKPISSNKTYQNQHRQKSISFKSNLMDNDKEKQSKAKSPLAKTEKQFLQRVAVNQYKKEQHLHQLRKEYHKNQDQQTGQSLFQPIITKDDIYWTVKSKQDKEDLELSKKIMNQITQGKELEAQKQNTFIFESFSAKNQTEQKEFISSIPQQLTKEQLEVIFHQMDNDHDGYISIDNIELREIGESDLKLIKEVLFEMENNNQRLNLKLFLKSCSNQGILAETKKKIETPSNLNSFRSNKSNNKVKQTSPINLKLKHSKPMIKQQQPQKNQPTPQTQNFSLPSKYQKLLDKYKGEEK